MAHQYRQHFGIWKSQIHTKHINTVCGQDAELYKPGGVYCIVTNGVLRVSFLNGLSAFGIPVLKVKLGVERVNGIPQDRQ
jgi:hypothetical protein